MAQLEQAAVDSKSTRQVQAKREREAAPAQRSGMLPVIAVLSAFAVGVVAWFSYSQGQRDALTSVGLPYTATSAATSDEAATTSADPTSTQLTADGSPATTMVQTPSYGKPDFIVTVHPTQNQAANATSSKPVKVARAVKPKTMIAAAAKPLDRQVALTSHPQPAYPMQAMRAGEQGTVLVLAQVDIAGHVSDTRVVRHSGSSVLDRAATDEVRRWKFEPALRDGRPIAANVEVPVNYRLDQ